MSGLQPSEPSGARVADNLHKLSCVLCDTLFGSHVPRQEIERVSAAQFAHRLCGISTLQLSLRFRHCCCAVVIARCD